MSAIISLEKINLAYGLDPLLDQVNCQIFAGERVCLIGRNGAGKSSFLKIIEGSIIPDSGKIFRSPSLRIARLTQELPQELNITVYDTVAKALQKTGELLSAYHHLSQNLQTEADLKRLAELQQAIDECQGWQFEQSISQILQRLELPADSLISELSGGWQRRVALAQALVIKPDLLLLDEPTNHLDIEAIQWLEDQLLNFEGGIVFITHDRAFLQRLATRIIELDRGHLYSWPGDYENFLRRKEETLAAEEKLNSEFDKKLAEEERWIRQGVKARRTRNEGRVRALKEMRQERSQRREQQGKASFEFNEATRSGELVVNAEHLNHAYGDKTIIKDFSIRIMRGDRIGLLGPNGVGKSTLLNILLGNIQADQGQISHGTKLQIAYFDQLRATLDPNKTIIDNVSDGRTSILINGKEKHIVSYLSDFLFSPQRLHTPVDALSGGERNRILLARLFSQPANVIVMDEPTNDLDVETLELLEELLAQFTGTVLLVSHDRAFLDNIVTSLLVFEGNGKVNEYIGGYQDWLKRSEKLAINKKTVDASSPSSVIKETPIRKKDQKLSYKEQKELAELPQKIDQLETKQAELIAKTSNPEFYQQAQEKITQALAELKQIEAELANAYSRWEELM